MLNEEKWVSMEDICDYLGCSRDTIKKMIRTQKLPAYKIDRKWKFKISEIDSWMRNCNRVTGKNDEVQHYDKND